MSTSRTETTLNLQDWKQLQQTISKQYSQAISVLKEFFLKQQQFHDETIRENIDKAFATLLASPALSNLERQALCYYQCLYFEIKSVLIDNPFTMPEQLNEVSATTNFFDIDVVEIPESLRSIYKVCNSSQFDAIFSACAKEQADIYAPCTLLLEALKIKHTTTEIITGSQELTSGLIILQQHLARYNLLMEAIRTPLQKIIQETSDAIQRLGVISGEETIIMSIEQQKARASRSLIHVQLALQKIRSQLEIYNEKITSSALEDILIKFLNNLAAEKQKLEQNTERNDHQNKKIYVINQIINKISDMIINHQTTQGIINAMIQIRNAPEYADVFWKPRNLWHLQVLFQPTSSLLRKLDKLIEDCSKLPNLDRPIIPDPYYETSLVSSSTQAHKSA